MTTIFTCKAGTNWEFRILLVCATMNKVISNVCVKKVPYCYEEFKTFLAGFEIVM